MFIGHIGLAFAAKRAAPRTPLVVLFAAAYLSDLLWPLLVLLGVESVTIVPGQTPFSPAEFVNYAWSHSLATVLLGSVIFALVFRLKTRDLGASVVTAALVASHWLLDFVVHPPDLQLAPGLEHRVGLGLWHAPRATVLVEGTLFVLGIVVYLAGTHALRLRGVVSLWAFLLVVGVLYAGSVVSPAPTTGALLAGVATCWLFMPWLAWIDRHRRAAVRLA